MKRRAVVLLGEDELVRVLHLNESERIHAVWPDSRRFGVMLGIEGDGLPEVAEGGEAPRVIRPLTIEALRREVSEFRSAWSRGDYDDRDFPTQAYLDDLHAVLDRGLFDA
jgi:hypothetical protein